MVFMKSMPSGASTWSYSRLATAEAMVMTNMTAPPRLAEAFICLETPRKEQMPRNWFSTTLLISALPITIWIDNESGYVVRTTVDMQDMMKALLERSMQESMDAMPENTELSVDVSKALVDCRISQFNAVPPIVIPDEARGNILAPEPEPEPKPAEESIVGTWVLFSGEDGETQSYVDLMVSLGMSMEFVFNADGTGSLSMVYGEENDFEEFTYTIENGQIVIDGNGAPYRIEDGMLHLTADDVALVFKRK